MTAKDEIARAEQDYERLRAAYLQIVEQQPGHEVGLAMVGADMDRAHAHLRRITGLRALPFTQESSRVVRRDAERAAQENA